MGSFSGGSTGLTINSTEPVSPNAGEIWSDDSTGYVRVRNAANDDWITIYPTVSKIIQNYSETIGDYTTPSTDARVSSGGTVVVESSASHTQESKFFQKEIGYGAGTIYKITQNVNNTSSVLYNKTLYKVELWLKKVGSPTGTATIGVWNSSDTLVFTFGTQNVSSLSTGYNWYSYENLTGYTLQNGDKVGLYWSTSPDYNNYITTQTSSSDVFDGSNTSCSAGTDLVFRFYEGNMITSNLDDDNIVTYWTSNAETNPFVYVDMGSSSTVSHIAIYLHSDTTETEIKIQTSTDASTWTDQRTISVSKLANGQWNYIRFNPVTARYVRVYGNSGSSKVLSISQIKVLNGQTDNDILFSHGHNEISTTSTSLGLSG